MEIKYYGHSCFAITIGEHQLLFDSFITGNPSAEGVDPKSIRTNFILVSHAHGDHMVDAFRIGHPNNAVMISNYEISEYYIKKGFKEVKGINHGGKVKLDFGTVRYVNAIHSSQFPDGTFGGNPGGFVIESSEGNFYFAGDTALTLDMKLIPMYCKLKFALLPVGGYFTMDYNDAVIASDFLECDKIIGMHFDTYPPIKINHEDALNAFRSKGKELILLKPGESISI